MMGIMMKEEEEMMIFKTRQNLTVPQGSLRRFKNLDARKPPQINYNRISVSGSQATFVQSSLKTHSTGAPGWLSLSSV